jgi:hypothetical protein
MKDGAVVDLWLLEKIIWCLYKFLSVVSRTPQRHYFCGVIFSLYGIQVFKNLQHVDRHLVLTKVVPQFASGNGVICLFEINEGCVQP